jgi:asparagine synthase (glutamine-hydrolysing)
MAGEPGGIRDGARCPDWRLAPHPQRKIDLSGILGTVRTDGGPASVADLQAMADAMAWAGPDGRSTWTGPSAALGHLAFNTSPQSAREPQPHADREGSLVITADARLDNRAELCRQLGLSGPGRGPAGDATLILEAYRQWGDDCAERLLGDFAFAIWDARRRRLYCARDHAGIRPLCYHHRGPVLVFASLPGPVARAAAVRRRLDRKRVADYLVQGLEARDRVSTFFEDIFRLPAAHALVFENGRVSTREYWRPDPGFRVELGSDAEYLEAFREVFTQAVADRLTGRRPVASMLSGGLDSSTIVGVARELEGARGRLPFGVFSGVSEPSEQCVETSFIHRVIAHGGLEPYEVSPQRGLDPDGRLCVVMDHVEEPWDTMGTMSWFLYRAARERGHEAMLDGVDGDLVASLPESYPGALARSGRLLTSWREYRHQSINYYRSKPSAWKYLRLARTSLAPRFLRRRKRDLTAGRRLSQAIDHSLISAEFANEIALGDLLEEHDIACALVRPAGLRQACVNRVTAPYLVAANERTWRKAVAQGIEPRKPFLDKRVIEFCLGLPWNQKARNGWSKYIVRRLAEEHLPPEVAWRRGWEHLGWRFTEARLLRDRDQIIETLERNRQRLAGFVDMHKYQQIVDTFRTQRQADERVRVLHGLAAWLEHNSFGS